MGENVSLAGKIAKAAIEVGGKLEPDKRNLEQKYDYISADKINALAGQALSKAGVVVFPTVTETNVERFDYVDRWDNAKSRYDARIKFVFMVSDGVSDLALEWTGAGSDYTTPDKAVYKAVTSGHKYFLMKLLSIGAGNEDGEHEPGEEEGAGSVKGNGGGKGPAQNVNAKFPPSGTSPAAKKEATKDPVVSLIDYTTDDLQRERSKVITALKKTDLPEERRKAGELKLAEIEAILKERGVTVA